MDLKFCTRCQLTLNITEFYEFNKAQNLTTPHIDTYCKTCRIQYSGERRKQIKIQAIEYLGGKCSACGLIDDPVIYDFHHLDPAQKDFSIGKQTKSFDKIKPELDKCILLCAHCHRKLHYNM